MDRSDVAPGIARGEDERRIRGKEHVASGTVRWTVGIVGVIVALYAAWVLISYLNEAAI